MYLNGLGCPSTSHVSRYARNVARGSACHGEVPVDCCISSRHLVGRACSRSRTRRQKMIPASIGVYVFGIRYLIFPSSNPSTFVKWTRADLLLVKSDCMMN